MASLNLQPGDWAPQFRVRASTAADFAFGTLGGRYVILSFLGAMRLEAAARAHAHIVARHGAWLDDAQATFFAVTADPADEAVLGDARGVHAFFDSDLAVSTLYGRVPEAGRYAPITYVLDPMLRVLAAIPLDAQHETRLDAVLAALPPAAQHAGVAMQAPVLILPRVFEPEFCRGLIDLYEADGGAPSGFMREIDGRTTLIHDERHKKRRDVLIADQGRRDQIRNRLWRRLVPGLLRAFQFEATRLERYLVACYDADSGGFFAPHRDNTTKGTAHRRFAVTINLDAEAYDGGDLRFPEYGPQTYRAPTGGAVVFSCSLLHEALPVTRGRRFAFLPFLFDEAAEVVRMQNLKFVDQVSVAKASTNLNN